MGISIQMSALRQEYLRNWLESLSDFTLNADSLRVASADASFRQYFRVDGLGGSSMIVMDAPPEHEDCRPFVLVAEKLAQAGVPAPKILAKDLDQGFMLLEDFGDRTMLQALNRAEVNVERTYRGALEVLADMQACTSVEGVPNYSAEKLRQEMDLFDEWFVKRHFQSELTQQEAQSLDRIKAQLIQSALSEGQVFVHRDYHSRNLMMPLTGSTDELRFGVIDFQDAVKGPVSYDVVSLLRDAYVEWPEDETLDWAIRYWQDARKKGVPLPDDPTEFYRHIDYMGLQRHLKILGIFARLNYRDGKSQYLKDLRLVTAYVRITAGRYDAFKPLLHLLDRLENREVQVGYTF